MLCRCILCRSKSVPVNFSCISRKSLVYFEGILMLSIESSTACMFVTMFDTKKLCVFSTLFIYVFLGVFANLRKETISFFMSVLLSVCLSVRPSVRMKQLASQRMDFLEIWYLSIFRMSFEKFQSNLTKKGYITRRLIYSFRDMSLTSA